MFNQLRAQIGRKAIFRCSMTIALIVASVMVSGGWAHHSEGSRSQDGTMPGRSLFKRQLQIVLKESEYSTTKYREMLVVELAETELDAGVEARLWSDEDAVSMSSYAWEMRELALQRMSAKEMTREAQSEVTELAMAADACINRLRSCLVLKYPGQTKAAGDTALRLLNELARRMGESEWKR